LKDWVSKGAVVSAVVLAVAPLTARGTGVAVGSESRAGGAGRGGDMEHDEQ
jgi:hypothetical protein